MYGSCYGSLNVVLTMGMLSLIMPSTIMVLPAYFILSDERMDSSMRFEHVLRDASPTTFEQQSSLSDCIISTADCLLQA